MSLLLGIDFGTSYFKVGLFDPTGALRGLGRVPVDKVAPRPGRSELPVADFWRLLREGLADALRQADANADEIVGLSYSSQANTLVLLDRTGRPITPLVIWNDQRANPVAANVAGFGSTDEFHRTTGFTGLTAEIAAVKWHWFQSEEPGIAMHMRRFMTLPDYFIFALTGEAAGDASTSALSGLLAVQSGEWWSNATGFFRIAPSALSCPLRPATVCGGTIARAQALLGLPPGVPCAVGGLDHYMAAIGSGLGRLGEASISTGTVLAALQLVDRVEPVAGCYHGQHFDGGFYRLAFDPAGAIQLEDYKRRSAPDFSIAELAALAATVAPGTPLDTETNQPTTTQRHAVAVRRIMERIGRTHHTLLQRLQSSNPATRVIATGGGARSSEWLQIKADMLGTTVIAPRCHERACLGAAAFAAVAAGLYDRVPEALQAMVHGDRVVEPRAAAVAAYAQQWPSVA